MSIGREAVRPNPALEPLMPLVGTWDTVGSHPHLPGTLHGRTSFEWIEGGAFLMARSEIDEPGVPDGIMIIGSDESVDQFFMIYFDERGVGRMVESTMGDGVWKWWRDAPGFRQRYVGTVSDDGRTMVVKGELSEDDVTWEPDLELTYTRAD